jgi:hypothetical protein
MEGADAKKPSLSELTARLAEQVIRLVRQEVMLAKAELFANGRQVVLGGGLLVTAAVVGLGGWLALIAAAVAGIAEALPVWGSALIVGAALIAIAGALAMAGVARLARGVPPLPMTAGSVRREVQLLTGRPGPDGKLALNGETGPSERTEQQ